MITSEAREVLSALIDREPVDPDALADVLQEAGARAMLVDFVRLRELVAADDDERPAGRPSAVSVEQRHSRDAGGWRLMTAAALLLGVGLGGGFWVGERLAQERPPAPQRTLEFRPGVDWQPVR